MNNTEKQTENNQEPAETRLNINLRTGLNHRNKFEEARTQIDYTSYYLGSIFWFIRVAVDAESLLELQTETKAYNEAQFRENIQFLAQIGEALCEWLPDYGSAVMFSSAKAEAKDNAEPALDLSDSPMEDLAQKLSDIMHNPNLPKEIQECLEENLSFNYIDFHTPENILGNLKQLGKTGGGE